MERAVVTSDNLLLIWRNIFTDSYFVDFVCLPFRFMENTGKISNGNMKRWNMFDRLRKETATSALDDLITFLFLVLGE